LVNLEDNGYIKIYKGFIGRKTNTTYAVTKAVEKAFTDHIAALENMIKGVKSFFLVKYFEMQSTFQIEENKRSIKRWLLVFMIVLVVSGITAIPIEDELSMATKFFSDESFIGNWLNRILFAIKDTDEKFPYLFYGYDWLAFAHVVIAIAFIGPYRDPVKNKWVIEFGAISCFLIVPF